MTSLEAVDVGDVVVVVWTSAVDITNTNGASFNSVVSLLPPPLPPIFAVSPLVFTALSFLNLPVQQGKAKGHSATLGFTNLCQSFVSHRHSSHMNIKPHLLIHFNAISC